MAESKPQRRNRTLRQYGITAEEFNAKLAEQEGRCALCREFRYPLNMDHCHARGANRGILCHNCNTGLGLFGDSVETLEMAIEYLKRHKGGEPVQGG